VKGQKRTSIRTKRERHDEITNTKKGSKRREPTFAGDTETEVKKEEKRNSKEHINPKKEGKSPGSRPGERKPSGIAGKGCEGKL